MSSYIDILNQDESSKDDDTQFWQSIGAIEDSKLIRVIAEQPVSATLEEVSSAPEAKLAHFHSLKLIKKPTKLSLSLKKPYRYSHQEFNAPLNDSTNSSTPLQLILQRFSKPVSPPEREKASS